MSTSVQDAASFKVERQLPSGPSPVPVADAARRAAAVPNNRFSMDPPRAGSDMGRSLKRSSSRTFYKADSAERQGNKKSRSSSSPSSPSPPASPTSEWMYSPAPPPVNNDGTVKAAAAAASCSSDVPRVARSDLEFNR